jgi:hypothetical protein
MKEMHYAAMAFICRGMEKRMPRKYNAKPVDPRSLARSFTSLAVHTLAGIARSAKCPAAARVTAAIALLDRGYGKPLQDHTDEDGGEIRVVIRHIVQRLGEPREAQTIEHEPIDDGDDELD